MLSFTWYVDNVAQSDSNNKTFTFNVSGITSACEKVVKVVGRFNGQITPAISITLSFVEEYLPISKVALEVNQTSTVKVAYSLPTTYKVTTATTLNPGTVTVNAIAPGYVGTEMVMAIREDIRQSIIDQVPMKRLAKPEEIADMVAYLASDKGEYITGATINLNGGLHMC